MTSTQNSTVGSVEWARTEIRALIRASVLQDRIVHTGYDRALYEELLAACDDSADCGAIQEFWGDDADEGEWRIHLTGCPVDESGAFDEA